MGFHQKIEDKYSVETEISGSIHAQVHYIRLLSRPAGNDPSSQTISHEQVAFSHFEINLHVLSARIGLAWQAPSC